MLDWEHFRLLMEELGKLAAQAGGKEILSYTIKKIAAPIGRLINAASGYFSLSQRRASVEEVLSKATEISEITKQLLIQDTEELANALDAANARLEAARDRIAQLEERLATLESKAAPPSKK